MNENEKSVVIQDQEDQEDHMKNEFLWKRACFEAGYLVCRFLKSPDDFRYSAILYKPMFMSFEEWTDKIVSSSNYRNSYFWNKMENNINKSDDEFSDSLANSIQLELESILVSHISQWKCDSQNKETPIFIDLTHIEISSVLDAMALSMNLNPSNYIYRVMEDNLNDTKKEALDFVNENWETIERVASALIYQGYLNTEEIEFLIKNNDIMDWNNKYGLSVIHDITLEVVVLLKDLNE